MNLVRREREIGFGLARPEYLGCDIATERRTVLEAMAGAAADDPAIAPCGVPIDQHVAVVAIFILADFGRRERAPGEGGESLRQIGADIGQPLFGAPPVGAVGSSVEHTSELQSLMRVSSAVFCLKQKRANERL